MAKLKLDPEALVVESFAAGADAAGLRGTVQAHSFFTASPNAACSGAASAQCEPTDPKAWSCGNTCINFCRASDAPGCTDL